MNDIPAINRLFSAAFTERYRQDGLGGIRVPHLNPLIWQYAISGAGDGAMLWRDGRGELVAFLMAHRSGTEGWMGPLAVRVDQQGSGVGAEIVRAGIAWLESTGATTIGLETMPRTMENIGFYSRLGFVPGHLTISLRSRRAQLAVDRNFESSSFLIEGESALGECLALSSRVGSGIDFSRELELTRELSLGDALLLRRDGALAAFVLWHRVPLVEGSREEDVRVLKLVAVDLEAALAALATLQSEVARRHKSALLLRCQGGEAALYAALIERGWRVQWTDLRLTLRDRPEAERRGVLLSNWEI